MQTQQHNIAVWEFIWLQFGLTKIYCMFLLKLNTILLILPFLANFYKLTDMLGTKNQKVKFNLKGFGLTQ